MGLSDLLEQHPSPHILLHSRNWKTMGFCRAYQILPENHHSKRSPRHIVSRFGCLHLRSPNPDGFEAADVSEKALVHFEYLWDCYPVSANFQSMKSGR